MSILLKDAVRLMSPNDTYSLYSRLHERLSKLVSQKKLIEAEILSIDNDGEDDPYMCANGKRECIYNKPDIERDLYSGKNIRNLDKIMEKYGVEGVYKVNGRNTWKVSQSNRNKLAQALTLFMPFERSENQTLQMFIVSNLKGGSGKSTLASNLAAALATQTMNSYRIGLIDLDPQGSATDIYLPYLDDDALSVGDLLLEEFELDDNETFESVCRDAFLEVNIPNVKVLPARTADARYDFYSKMKGLESQEKGVVYHSHDQLMRIVEAVKDDFDIILFDTPPQLNEAAFAAHFVATSSIIPMRSEQNDRDSTIKYMEQLKSLYRSMVSAGHKGYNSIHLIQMALSTQSKTEMTIATEIDTLTSGNSLTHFLSSEAIKRCSTLFKNIFELSPSEFAKKDTDTNKAQYGSREMLMKAQDNVKTIALEIEREVLKVWEYQEDQAEKQRG